MSNKPTHISGYIKRPLLYHKKRQKEIAHFKTPFSIILIEFDFLGLIFNHCEKLRNLVLLFVTLRLLTMMWSSTQ